MVSGRLGRIGDGADQLRRGCNPARMLAKGLLKAQARAASPPPPPAAEPAAPPPPRAPRPYDPVGAAMRRAAAAMRAAIASYGSGCARQMEARVIRRIDPISPIARSIET